MIDIMIMSFVTAILIGFVLMGIGAGLTIDWLVDLGFGIVMASCAIAALFALIIGWFAVLRY